MTVATPPPNNATPPTRRPVLWRRVLFSRCFGWASIILLVLTLVIGLSLFTNYNACIPGAHGCTDISNPFGLPVQVYAVLFVMAALGGVGTLITVVRETWQAVASIKRQVSAWRRKRKTPSPS